MPNTDHNTRYVYWVYNDLLGRSPDTAGVNYWASLLNSGVPRPTVAWALVNSNEYRGDVLGGMYQQFLGRSIDATGLAYWTNQVAGGMTLRAVPVVAHRLRPSTSSAGPRGRATTPTS